jgi:hypothetical protein
VPAVVDGTATSRVSDSDEYRLKEANRRMQVLETFWALLKAGYTKLAAAREVQSSQPSIYRWEAAYKKDGFAGLLPHTDKCGRPSFIEKYGVTEEELNQFRGLHLDTESCTQALRVYARSDRCRPDLAAAILDPNRCSKHALPPSLVRAVRNNAAVLAAHRGPRALSLGGMWTPRKMDILPGDIFCADDTTPIWAWWVPWPESEEYPFGAKLLQGQFIPIMGL